MSFMREYGLGLAAIGLYIIGGIGTFSGIGMIALVGEDDLLGLGSGKSLGYLFVCVGVCLSIIGVLAMRLFRNHFALPKKTTS